MLSDRIATRTGLLAILTAILSLNAGVVKADVLYDSLNIITDGLANNTASPAFIGYYQPNDIFLDLNIADDFVVPAGPGYGITSVTQPFRSVAVQNPSLPTGILVEFFANSELNRPEQMPVSAFFTTDYTVESFMYGDLPSWYFTVDLSGAGVELGAGTWWVSITPVDESETAGDWRVFRQTGGATLIGNPANNRWGGDAHGTYPASIFYSNPEWAPFPPFQGGASNLAMMIEGTLIPTPGALALLGVAGLARTRRRDCSA